MKGKIMVDNLVAENPIQEIDPRASQLLNLVLIIQEGYQQFLKKDTTGHLSGGYGHNFDANGISKKAAAYLLQEDIIKTNVEFFRNYPWAHDLDTVRKMVLLNMHFNLGAAGFSKFTGVINAIKTGDFITASKEIRNSLAYQQDTNRYELLAQWVETGAIDNEYLARINTCS
jgi:lysozyme